MRFPQDCVDLPVPPLVKEQGTKIRNRKRGGKVSKGFKNSSGSSGNGGSGGSSGSSSGSGESAIYDRGERERDEVKTEIKDEAGICSDGSAQVKAFDYVPCPLRVSVAQLGAVLAGGESLFGPSSPVPFQEQVQYMKRVQIHVYVQ